MINEIAIRNMISTDAAGLSACIERCYGGAYPKPMMYQPALLAEQVRLGLYSGVVALANNDVVGHIGYHLPTPAATIVEAGTTVVDARCRGAGLMRQMASQLRDSIIADGFAGFIHFPTTAHTVMQRASLQSGGCETGVMLACLPSNARDIAIGGSGEGRLAVTVVYQPLGDAPDRSIFMPERYEGLINRFASDLHLRRTLSPMVTMQSGTTKLRSTIGSDSKRIRIIIERIGMDFADALRSTLAGQDATLFHVDLLMDQPEINHAVEVLGGLGFAFAAWLPGWDASDVLRLQRPERMTESELNPILHSPTANEIAALIRSELNAFAPASMILNSH